MSLTPEQIINTARDNAKKAEVSRLNQCVNVTDNQDKCYYDMSSKIREFLHKDTYILEHTNNIKKDDSNDRMKVFYSKFFQPYKVNKKKK